MEKHALPKKTDVLIAGSSAAGATAAMLFANSGLTVRVIDRINDINHYKVLCTHFIQPSGVPTLRKLGWDKKIIAAGGIENKVQIWTEMGWIIGQGPYVSDTASAPAINIERRILDPLMRKELVEHPNIDYVLDRKVIDIRFREDDPERAEYFVCKDEAGQEHTYTANLLVAADGRFSTIARITGNPEETLNNNRVNIFCYFKNLPLHSNGHSQYWLLNPDMAYTFPLAEDTTLLCLMISKTEFDKWREEDKVEANFYAKFRTLNNGPDIDSGTRISPIHQMLDLTNRFRKLTHKGIAFIGDAGMALDPAAGIGCGFAFQAADWLSEATIPALKEGKSDLTEELEAFAKNHQKNLRSHALGICGDSLARKESPANLAMYRDIANDPELTDTFLALVGRIIQPEVFQTRFMKKKLAALTAG